MKKIFVILTVASLVNLPAAWASVEPEWETGSFRNEKFASPSDELYALREKVISAASDSIRIMCNDSFVHALENILGDEKSFKQSFDSLKQTGILSPPDKSFRIITWNLPFNDGSHQYFCYIQTFFKKKKGYRVYKLIDKSSEIKAPEKKILSKDQWFGALYYAIIPCRVKNGHYYTLLGWDGNSASTTKKIIDVLYFASNGEPKFGAGIFEHGKITRKRVFFEYSSKAVMSLRYHPEKNLIIFDHLSPSHPEMEGMFQYYGPDLSFDGYEWVKDKWIYIEDVDARLNTENPVYNPEIKSDEIPVYKPGK